MIQIYNSIEVSTGDIYGLLAQEEIDKILKILNNVEKYSYDRDVTWLKYVYYFSKQFKEEFKSIIYASGFDSYYSIDFEFFKTKENEKTIERNINNLSCDLTRYWEGVIRIIFSTKVFNKDSVIEFLDNILKIITKWILTSKTLEKLIN